MFINVYLWGQQRKIPEKHWLMSEPSGDEMNVTEIPTGPALSFQSMSQIL